MTVFVIEDNLRRFYKSRSNHIRGYFMGILVLEVNASSLIELVLVDMYYLVLNPYDYFFTRDFRLIQFNELDLDESYKTLV